MVEQRPLVKRGEQTSETHTQMLYAHAGYDNEATRQTLLAYGILPHIWRRNTYQGKGLEKVPVRYQEKR